MAHKIRLLPKLILSGSLLFSFLAVASISTKEAMETNAYSVTSLPTTIDLNDNTASDIREYYSSLAVLDSSERQGSNLLKNLKPILKNGQQYLSYDSTNSIWDVYCIVDRDWTHSPASSLPSTAGTYDSSTNKITGYKWGSNSDKYENPYLHALYYNRKNTSIAQAYGDHDNNTSTGINREHIWPKGAGFETKGAGGARGDIMHLWAAHGHTNNKHSNYYYGNVDKTQSYDDEGSSFSVCTGNLLGKSELFPSASTKVFEPQDSDKGDIARACFYMAARYNYLSGSDSDGIDSNNPNLELVNDVSYFSNNGYASTTTSTGKLGILQDLLEWNRLDPPDEFEIHRNNLCYNNFTKNRNPFIDFPEWAEYIWGTCTDGAYDSSVTGYAKPASDVINDFSDDGKAVSSVSVSPTSVSLNLSGDKYRVLTPSVMADEGVDESVTWESFDEDVVTVEDGVLTAIGTGSATITVKSVYDETKFATCAVTVTNSDSSTPTVSGYYKVTSTSDLIDGEYLIVYEDGGVAFNGALTTLDAASNTIDVTISDGYIASNSTVKASTFIYDSSVGTWKSKSGYYIGQNTDANGLATSNSTVYTNTSSIDSDGNAVIVSSGGAYLRFNYASNQTRFRYYKSSSYTGQKAIQLYKYNAGNVSLSSLTLSGQTTEFALGSSFSFDGTATANYSDASSTNVTSSVIFAGYDMNTLGTQKVVATYTESGTTKSAMYTINVVPASISASVNKTYKVGDTISINDITVTTDSSQTLDVFEFDNDGYQFTYEDAASGGALTNKTFKDAVSYGTKTCDLTVQVQRDGYDSVAIDTLNKELTGVSGNSYSSWSGKTSSSSAVYAGNSSGGNSSIQLRSGADTSGNYSGIITTTSGGYASKISVSWESNTVNGRTVLVYGKNSAYTSPNELISEDDDEKGTLLGSIIYGTSTELEITDSYAFIGLRSSSGALYLSEIKITYGSNNSANLAHFMMYQDTSNQCESKLDTALSYFKMLSTDDRVTFMTSSDYVISTARARLLAWLTNQGKTINYVDGDYEVSSLSNTPIVPYHVSDNSSMVALIIIVAAAFIAVTTYFLLRRKYQ